MNKKMLLRGAVLVAVAVIVGGVMWLFLRTPPDDTTGGKQPSGKSAYKIVAACTALSLTDARAVLGDGARAGSANGSSDTASDDIAVSTCSYSDGSAESISSTKTLTLLSRSAKTRAGAESNRAVFGPEKPAGKRDVSGVGDAAFWDAQLSQLDILQGNNWYIIGNMNGTHADSGTLDVSRAAYARIRAKL